MKSSSGQHFVALDHIRAIAAFVVFTWHFIHGSNGSPVPFEGAPALFPAAILDEGHTGVALFMTLSGYLFAKLLDGKTIRYSDFLWNRALRLLPLLTVAVLLGGLQLWRGGQDLLPYVKNVICGVIYPSLPNGGWSITAEFHFYLILPALLYLLRKSPAMALSLVTTAIALRIALYLYYGEIQSLAYWTIIGRLDQFVIGMLAFHLSSTLMPYRKALLTVILAFLMFWWWFDDTGGFYQRPTYPSPSQLWICIPTLEAVAYSAFIIWYESLNLRTDTVPSRLFSKLGEYSYSIYLLHFFIVFKAAHFIHVHVMDLSNFYVAIAWSAVMFVLMAVVGYLSFRFIESPFLKFRRPYVVAKYDENRPSFSNAVP